MNKEIILIDKHKGITSFDVIRIVRKLIDIRKIGHAGTLDPNATGLMILGIGKGTKKLSTFLKLPKVYKAEILLGTKTDSGDIDGTVLKKGTTSPLPKSQINEALSSLVGTNTLPVPIYSAIKKDGKRLYKYAREGQAVEIPTKNMFVNEAKILTYKHPLVTLSIDVESGTYIRSIAEKLGENLNTYGTVSNLRRLSIGDLFIKDSWKISTEEEKEKFTNWYLQD